MERQKGGCYIITSWGCVKETPNIEWSSLIRTSTVAQWSPCRRCNPYRWTKDTLNRDKGAHLQDPYLPVQFMSVQCSDRYYLDPKDAVRINYHLTLLKDSRYAATKPHRILNLSYGVSCLSVVRYSNWNPAIIWPCARNSTVRAHMSTV